MRDHPARLKRRADFVRVSRAGRKSATSSLVLQALPSTSADTAGQGFRVGFTVTKKVGKAVARNRARRRLRAAAAEVMPVRAAPGHDYVIVARGAAVTCPYRTLTSDLVTALRRVGALHRPEQRGQEGA